MKICHVSDTHMSHWQLNMPEADILVHTGDISGITSMKELIDVNNWFASLQGKYREIFFVPGNHDGQFEDFHNAEIMLSNATVLFDKQITFDGHKIYGSPWTTTFFDWWFMKDRDKINEVWEKIPEDISILLTHQPPFMILDRATEYTKRGAWGDDDDTKKIVNVGCKELRRHCMTRLKKLKAHCFGHLHMDGGRTHEENGIIFSNGAVLNDYYFVTNGPNVIEI